MFEYHLPKEKIAKYPVEPPDKCKILIYNKKTDKITDEIFENIVNYLDKDYVLVFNNTKVQPVRIECNFENGKMCDFIIYKIVNEKEIHILTKLSRKTMPVTLYKDNKKLGCIVARTEFGFKLVLEENVKNLIKNYGTMPIPPYLKRRPVDDDYRWYQSIFAKDGFSIASPTASLHFTENVLRKIREKNIECFFLRLDIHFSTIFEHNRIPPDLAGEYYEIKEECFRTLCERKKEGKKIIAVGTTVCKALETIALTGKLSGVSLIFIKHPFEFKLTDGLITNFHRSKSPTLELVCAFLGIEKTATIYTHALNNNYRFLSYGDAMFIY